jgi:uncharacterized sodium:solute symporter family permease YidK
MRIKVFILVSQILSNLFMLIFYIPTTLVLIRDKSYIIDSFNLVYPLLVLLPITIIFFFLALILTIVYSIRESLKQSLFSYIWFLIILIEILIESYFPLVGTSRIAIYRSTLFLMTAILSPIFNLIKIINNGSNIEESCQE